MPRKSRVKARAVDAVGRETSDAALKANRSKGVAVSNRASSPDVAKRASMFVQDFLSRSETSRTILNDKFAVLYSLWNGDPVSEYFPTGRCVHVPEAYKAVEGFVPRAVDVLIGQPGWFRVVGIDDEGKQNAEKITNLIMAQLKRDRFESKFRSFIRDSAVYGFSPGKVRWKNRRKKFKYNKVKKQRDGANVKLEVREADDEVILDGPTVEHTDIYDFFVDLRFHGVQEDSPGVCFRNERFEDELKEMQEAGHYVNVNELIKPSRDRNADKNASGPPGTMLNPSTFKQLRDARDGISLDTTLDRPVSRIYEVYEFWGRFDPKWDPAKPDDQGEEKEYVITMARRRSERNDGGGWVVLRVAENPYWHGMRPVVVAHHIRRSHCFQSVGIIEPIIRLQQELDDSRNMALAARALTVKPLVVATDDADIYSNNMTIDPGTVIHTRSKGAIEFPFIPDRSDAAYKSEGVIKQDIRETTGIVSFLQGVADEASETATSVVNRTQEANKRIAEVCHNIANDFLIPMLEMFHGMNQQMITEERLVELVGPDGVTMKLEKVSPAEVAGKVNFEITALPQIAMAGLEARMLLSFLTNSAPFLQLDPQIVRPAELLKMAWVKMFGTNNLDRVFPSAERPLKLRTADDEHMVIGMGHMVEPQEGENYNEHLTKHQKFTTDPVFDRWPDDAQARLLAHIESTRLRFEQEREAQMPRMPLDVMQAQQMAANPPPPPGMEPQQAQGGAPNKPGQAAGAMGMQGQAGPGGPTGQVRSNMAAMEPRTPYGFGEE